MHQGTGVLYYKSGKYWWDIEAGAASYTMPPDPSGFEGIGGARCHVQRARPLTVRGEGGEGGIAALGAAVAVAVAVDARHRRPSVVLADWWGSNSCRHGGVGGGTSKREREKERAG